MLASKQLWAGFLFGPCVIGLSATAHAQDAQSDGGRLQDIVVTARRTSELLQNTPVSVTAVQGRTLDTLNIMDVQAVPQLVPNITLSKVTASPSTAAIFIRGIGNTESSLVSEQGVGIYLNGVYIARSATAIFDLIDLDRIEVMRGPQGTLFGRNSVGGAIQMVSKTPSQDMHAEVKAGYGTDNDWFGRVRLETGEFGPFRMAVSYMHHQRDGYVNNLLTPKSRDPGSMNSDSVFVSLHGDFGKLTADYSFDYDNRRGQGSLAQIVASTPDFYSYFSKSASLGGAPFLFGPGRRSEGLQEGDVDQNGKYRTDTRSTIQGHALTLALEVSPALTIKSITGYRRFHQDQVVNVSGNALLKGMVYDPVTKTVSIQPVTPYNNTAEGHHRQFSQELQALGKIGDFSYVLGAYYFHEKAREALYQKLTFVMPGGDLGMNLSPVQAYGGTTRSTAAFGQISWKPAALDEKLEITGGMRYTSDRKTILLTGDVPDLTGRKSFHNVSWLASASYKFTPDVLGYVRVSTGYRAGGLSPRTNFLNPFKPEKATAYEVGLKTELFDHKLRFNLAAFLTQYRQLQINQFKADAGGATTLTVNAGNVNYSGFEAEFTVIPVKRLTVDGAIGYTNAHFKSFLYRDPKTNLLIDVADEARMQQAAKVNAHIGAQYVAPLPFGQLLARVDFSYRSKVYFGSLDRAAQFNHAVASPADYNLRARLALTDVSVGTAKLEFGVWGDNLTNDKNIEYGVDFGSLGFGLVTYKRPRSIGFDTKIGF